MTLSSEARVLTTGWRCIDVRFNCEPHHVIFAVEYYLRVQPYWVIWV